MKSKVVNNAKLGLFVMAGFLFLILSLYMIGRNRSMFGSTFEIYASFNNINGLMTGNNVRFSGIDVGTVRRIEIKNDSSIYVTLIIDQKIKQYIRKNAVASIATDGLMGNKMLNINTQKGFAEYIQEGDLIQSRKAIETDEMLRTLNTTNDNIAVISTNLKEITSKLNNSNSLWNLLADTLVSHDIRQAVTAIRKAGANTERFTDQADQLVQRLKEGEGLAGTLLTDTVMVNSLRNALTDVQQASQNAASLTNDLSEMIDAIERGNGTAGMLISDTVWSAKLYQSLVNIEEGTSRFNENMEAMKHNFLFKGYFKKQEKQSRKKKD